MKKETLEKGKYDMNMTAQEVADHLGVSRQAIADIEKKVLRKLRKRLIEKGIEAHNILPDD